MFAFSESGLKVRFIWPLIVSGLVWKGLDRPGLVGTFVVLVSSVWLWCVKSVSSRSLTASTTSFVTAETSRPASTKQTFRVCRLHGLRVRRAVSHLPRWRAAGIEGGAPAGWRSPERRRTERWRDQQEAGRRSSPQGPSAGPGSGRRRRPSARPHKRPPGGVRTEKISAGVDLIWALPAEQKRQSYLQGQTQRAEKQQQVTHETQQVRWEGLRGCQPTRELLH